MPSGYRSPTARPMSFIWTRRIVLTLMAVFAALPVYVMISTSLKPLQGEHDPPGPDERHRPGGRRPVSARHDYSSCPSGR